MSSIERRFLAAQVRGVSGAQSFNSPGTIEGYSAKFNSLSEDLGGFKERLAVDCFDRCLGTNPDVRCLMNHDPNLVLGRTASGTLKLFTDTLGLRMSCLLPNTQVGRDLYTSVQRGDISQQSFAFTCEDQDWADEDDGTGARIAIRTIRKAFLLDVSAVTYPAYASTSVSAKASREMDDECDEDDDDCVEKYSRKLWPAGVPVEVRNHIPALRIANRAESRRSFVNKVLGI